MLFQKLSIPISCTVLGLNLLISVVVLVKLHTLHSKISFVGSRRESNKEVQWVEVKTEIQKGGRVNNFGTSRSWGYTVKHFGISRGKAGGGGGN